MVTGMSTHSRELDQTSTWAVSTVCAVIILISIIMEKVLHHLGEWFTERRKMALYEALEKVKAELMLLGFISLLLTFFQNYISKICVPLRLANTMLPCPYIGELAGELAGDHGGNNTGDHGLKPPAADHGVIPELNNAGEAGHGGGEHHRRLLWSERRFLSAGSEVFSCKPGYEPLISLNGLHQLHIFIFFLAVFHVAFGATTMMLGRLKIRGWKEWERDALSNEELSNDPSRFRLTHETSFVKSHSNPLTKFRFFFYVVCFFRQFFRSVRRSDYQTMRNGFVTVHLAPGSKFNFQKYIMRSLEDDFKVVVGISPLLWASVVVYLLVNVSGWQAMFWISVAPLVVILAVGTKLQAIITQMALEIVERHAVVQGIPLVQVSDRHFWFGWPQLVLYLIHFSLFQNAFQITYFLWIWYEFGLDSCFHQNMNLIILRAILGVLVQFMCSYITLPLYALVTQMGSTMKKSIFDDQTSKALKKWHKNAVKKTEGKPIPSTTTRTLGGSPGDTPEHSAHQNSRFNHNGQSRDHEIMSDVEARHHDQSAAATVIANVDQGSLESQTAGQQNHVVGRRRTNMPDDLLTGP